MLDTQKQSAHNIEYTKELRCTGICHDGIKCGKLLAKGKMAELTETARVEIKCQKCGKKNYF